MADTSRRPLTPAFARFVRKPVRRDVPWEELTPEERMQILQEGGRDLPGEPTADFVAESERGLQQQMANWVGSAARMGEAAAGLGQTLPLVGEAFQPASEMLQTVGEAAEMMRPERPVEGMAGAVMSSLNPVEWFKVAAGVTLGPGGVLGRVGSFGLVSAAESAGLQKSRENEVAMGQVFAAGLRGAATGTVDALVAPWNMGGRMLGLAGYGAIEPLLFEPDEVTPEMMLESAVMTGLYGAVPTGYRRGEGLVTAPGILSPKRTVLSWFGVDPAGNRTSVKDTPAEAAAEGMDKPPADVLADIPEMFRRAKETLDNPNATPAEKSQARTFVDNAVNALRRKETVDGLLAVRGEAAYARAIEDGKTPAEAERAKNGEMASFSGVIDSLVKDYDVRLTREGATGLLADQLSSGEAMQMLEFMAQSPGVRGRKEVNAALTRAAAGERVSPEELQNIFKALGDVGYSLPAHPGPGSRGLAYPYAEGPVFRPEDLRSGLERQPPPPPSPRDLLGLSDVAPPRPRAIEPSEPIPLPGRPGPPGPGLAYPGAGPRVPLQAPDVRAGLPVQPARPRAARDVLGLSDAPAPRRTPDHEVLAEQVQQAVGEAQRIAFEITADMQSRGMSAGEIKARQNEVFRRELRKRLAVIEQTPAGRKVAESVLRESGVIEGDPLARPRGEAQRIARDEAGAEYARLREEGWSHEDAGVMAKDRFASEISRQRRPILDDADIESGAKRAAQEARERAVIERRPPEELSAIEQEAYASERARLQEMVDPEYATERQRLSEEISKALRYTDDQAEAYLRVADGLARSAAIELGINPSEFLARISYVGKRRPKGVSKEVTGLTRFLDDGKAVIEAFTGANISTGLHELAHVWRRYGLGDDSIAFLEKELKVKKDKNGNWKDEFDELLARQFERYFREGKVSNPKLRPFMEKFRRWMTDIYQTLKGSDIWVPMSDKMRQFIESHVFPDEVVPSRKSTGPTAGGADVLFQMKGTSYGSEPPAPRVPEGFSNAMKRAKNVTAGVGELGASLMEHTFGFWATPLNNVVRKRYPEFSARVQKTIDAYNAEFKGKFVDDIRSLAKAYGGLKYHLPNSEFKKADLELQSGDFIDAGSGVSYKHAKIQRVAEQKMDISDLSPKAREIYRSWEQIRNRAAKMAEEMGVLIRVPVRDPMDPSIITWEKVPFKGRDDRYIRMMTDEMHHILELGPDHPDFIDVANAIQHANGYDVPGKGLRQLDLMRERSLEKEAAFEVGRLIEEMPTHVKMRSGRVVEIIGSDPIAAGVRLAESSAMRLAVIREFGQEFPWSAHVSSYVRERGGRRGDIEDLIRSINGMPVTIADKVLATPGSKAYDVLEVAKFANSVLRTSLLTTSVVPNIPESFSKTFAMGGGKAWIQAWKDILSDPKGAYLETSRKGQASYDVMNLAYNPHHPWRSMSRIFREALLRGTGAKFMNELNELHAGRVGDILAKDLRSGRKSNWDRERLKLLEFSKQEADLVLGEADGMSADAARSLAEERGLYRAIGTRMSEFTQGSTSTAAQRSRASNSPTWRTLVAFDSYGQMTFDRMGRVMVNAYEAAHNFKEAYRSGDKAATKAAGREVALSGSMLGGMLAGHAAAGTMAMFLRSLFVGGTPGSSVFLQQAEDEPLETVLTGAIYATFAGPAEAMFRTVTTPDTRDLRRVLTNSVLPVSKFIEFVDYVNGGERYRGMGWMAKSAAFFRSNAPVFNTAPMKTFGTVFGFAAPDLERDAALKGFWRWRRKNYPFTPGGGPTGLFPDEQAQFTQHMKAAYTAIKKNEPEDEITRHLERALGVESKDPKSVRGSIRNRILLRGKLKEGTELNAQLRKNIGEAAYAQLVLHDELLRTWAESIK